MGDQNVDNERLSGAQMRAFMQNVLRDLRALEKMIADGSIESGADTPASAPKSGLVRSPMVRRMANRALFMSLRWIGVDADRRP